MEKQWTVVNGKLHTFHYNRNHEQVDFRKGIYSFPRNFFDYKIGDKVGVHYIDDYGNEFKITVVFDKKILVKETDDWEEYKLEYIGQFGGQVFSESFNFKKSKPIKVCKYDSELPPPKGGGFWSRSRSARPER